MAAHSSVRIALGIAVAVAFLFGGVASASACQDGGDCDDLLDVETDDKKENVYVSQGLQGSADLTGPANASTEHSAYVHVNTGYLDVSVNRTVSKP
jgi:hypothetical protein